MTHADLTAAAPTPHHHVMIATGDAEVAVTFEDLYAARYAAMVRLAHTLVDTRQRAEEVVQDAFAAVYARRGQGPAQRPHPRPDGTRRTLRHHTAGRVIGVSDPGVITLDRSHHRE